MVGDDNHADFSSNPLRAPREIAGFETQGTELLVATTSANKMDPLRADTGICWLAPLFKGSEESMSGAKNYLIEAGESTSSFDNRRA